MNTAVVERTSSDKVQEAPCSRKHPSLSDWDWRIPPSRGDTDPVTARRARQFRTRWRLSNPDEWRGQLKALSHFDSDYIYDEGHEYTEDWTSDPDYPFESRLEYDQDDFLVPPHSWHVTYLTTILLALQELFRRGLNLAVSEPELHFDSETSRALLLLTDGGNLKTQVNPDVAVLPAQADYAKHRVLRTDLGEEIPVMVVEVVSPTSVERDRDEKFRLYARLGIVEYLLVYLGDADIPVESDLRLEMFRLQDNGAYTLTGEASGGPPYRSIHSRVCGTSLRIGPPRDKVEVPLFQWYDSDQGRWRDTFSDERFEGRAEGRTEGLAEGRAEGHAEGQLNLALKMLEHWLPADADTDMVAKQWSDTGIPENIDDLILAVQANPEQWRTILGMDDNGIADDLSDGLG